MILITGATGNNGAELTKRLAGSMARVRAMVRKHPEAADALPGIEYVIADFDDPVSIRQAQEGVQRAFLTTNSTERVEAQQLNFVEEARAAGDCALYFDGHLAITPSRSTANPSGPRCPFSTTSAPSLKVSGTTPV